MLLDNSGTLRWRSTRVAWEIFKEFGQLQVPSLQEFRDLSLIKKFEELRLSK